MQFTSFIASYELITDEPHIRVDMPLSLVYKLKYSL